MNSLLNNTCWKKDNNNSSSSDNNNNSSVVNDNGIFNIKRVCGCGIVTVLWLILFVVVIFDPLRNDQDYAPILEFQINSVDMKVYNNNNNVSNDYYSIIVSSTKQQQLMAGYLEFNLTLKNKQHGLIYFSPMELSLEYDELFMSSTMLEPFLLVEDQRRLQFGMQIKDDDLQNRNVDSVVSSRVLSDQNNLVPFALKGNGRCVRWDRGVFYSCGINLLCDDIKVGMLPTNANNHTIGLCKCNFDCHIV